MDLTVDKLEQMFQNVEVTLDCMFRRMRWEMQQEKDGSFPLDPLLPFEELEFFQKRLAALVGETREIRAQKQQTMAAIVEKVNRSTKLARDVQSRAAVPGVAALLPAAEHDAEDAPVAVSVVPPSRPDAPVQSQAPAQCKSTRPGRGGAQDRRTGQSSAGAPPGPRGRRASTPPGGPLRRRRPPL
ncbi:SKA complex subunit 2 isoform X2 [Alosa pseudoharengus]|uniref:SKA complex subunit 2 isoform X2 n=1 Tax=Alosa pseudoharengus TaxID=34774 RepID=UPI003F88F88B